MRKEHKNLTKTEMKEIARETMADAIGCVYYKICDSDDYTEEQVEIILQYMAKFGRAACKAIGTTYTTY